MRQGVGLLATQTTGELLRTSDETIAFTSDAVAAIGCPLAVTVLRL